MNPARDWDGVTVRRMNPFPGKGPVFYTSLTREPHAKGLKTTLRSREGEKAFTSGSPDRESCKAFLVSILLDHQVAAMETPLRKDVQSSSRAAFPIRVLRGPLGRPELLLGEDQGPAISFSEGGGRVWAALCGDGSDIGIDVAGSDEFRGEYPYRRVFHPQELQHALKLAGGDLGEASALLWSIKEAVVKALGCGFHLADPLQITVYPATGAAAEGSGYTFTVGLSGKALVRFPTTFDRPLRVQSLHLQKMWLSIALLERSPAGHE